MTYIRSIIFMVCFYLMNALEMIAFFPFYFLGPRKKGWVFVHIWSRTNVWLMKVIAGADFEFRNTEKLPDTGYIIAPKHQSAFDTFCFLPWFRDPVLILKRELMWVPLFGWYVAKQQMIPIDRGSREKAIAKVNIGAHKAMEQNRELLIYPEGTRRAPGAPPAYKSGIAHLYQELNVPVVPIAHNAGLFWPKNKVVRHKGKILAEVLDPIEPGLPRKEFMAELIKRTEDACDRLLLETVRSDECPPLPPTAITRLREMGFDEKGNPLAG